MQELRLSQPSLVLLTYIEHVPHRNTRKNRTEQNSTTPSTASDDGVEVVYVFSHTGLATADIIARSSHTVRSDLESVNYWDNAYTLVARSSSSDGCSASGNGL